MPDADGPPADPRSPRPPPPARGVLWVVATPIGNLADLTPRAVDTLREAELILAEDTRRTRGLLAHHGIRTPLQSFDAHKERAFAARIVQRLREGARIALVSDAGTPGLSDPGGRLVRAALTAGLDVSPIPGPSAVAAAASVAGLDGPFRFDGFLPRKGGERRRRLELLRASDVPVVLFESPQRLHGTLGDLARTLGPDRRALVCRELTKLHEEIRSSTLESLASFYEQEPLGEVTLVVYPSETAAEATGEATGTRVGGLTPEGLARRFLAEGLSPSRVARLLEELCDLPHREAYRIAHERAAAREDE